MTTSFSEASAFFFILSSCLMSQFVPISARSSNSCTSWSASDSDAFSCIFSIAVRAWFMLDKADSIVALIGVATSKDGASGVAQQWGRILFHELASETIAQKGHIREKLDDG